MLNVKKIRITKIKEYKSVEQALKFAKGASEIRAITEMGDLVITSDELKDLKKK